MTRYNLRKRSRSFADLAFAGGFGITLHAVANEMYYKGGYAEILRPQGEYIGLIVMLAAYMAIRVIFAKKNCNKTEKEKQ